MATYVSESARYTMLLGKFEENHAKEKQKARAQLEMALASIQTELEFFAAAATRCNRPPHRFATSAGR